MRKRSTEILEKLILSNSKSMEVKNSSQHIGYH